VLTLLAGKWLEIDAQDEQGMTALHFASKYGQVAAVRTLLKTGARMTVLDKDGFAPLHLASLNGCQRVAELLILKRANVHVRSKSGATALHLAALVEGPRFTVQQKGDTLRQPNCSLSIRPPRK
jgi:ankyrin repeat protein